MNYDALEDSLSDVLSRGGKYLRNIRKPIKRVTVPAAGVVAGVGMASGGYLWHVNRENERRYGAR